MSERPHACGLIPTEDDGVPTAPLMDGPDISWINRCRLGDNQGRDGACAIFSLASWAEIMFGKAISDTECLHTYHETLQRLNLPPNSGLTFKDAFAAAKSAGWLRNMTRIVRVHDIYALRTQPILAAYKVTPAWDKVSPQGCLKHDEGDKSRGLHAVDIVGFGAIPGVDKKCVWIENSWGQWGWRGLGVMTTDLHDSLMQEMWILA